jgi:hypothetical protein
VVLIPQKPDDIGKLIDKAEEVTGLLKELRSSMRDDGPGEVELDAVKPDNYLVYLIEWATRAKKKHRSIQLKASANKKRAEVEARRSGRKKSVKS